MRDEHRSFLQRLENELDVPGVVTVDMVWEKLCEYWNYLNYTLLQNLINRFSDDALSKVMDEYEEKVRALS